MKKIILLNGTVKKIICLQKPNPKLTYRHVWDVKIQNFLRSPENYDQIYI